MGVLEIVLLIVGGILAALSFVIPAAQEEVSQETIDLARDEIKTLVGRQMEDIRNHVDDVVDEAVEYAMEKTERSLERLSNEKIMAVNEYSDTVLQEIHKNHEETMFLYDMLNQKHTDLKNTVSEVNKTVQEVQETRQEAEDTKREIQTDRQEAKQEAEKFNQAVQAARQEAKQEAEKLNQEVQAARQEAKQEAEKLNQEVRAARQEARRQAELVVETFRKMKAEVIPGKQSGKTESPNHLDGDTKASAGREAPATFHEEVTPQETLITRSDETAVSPQNSVSDETIVPHENVISQETSMSHMTSASDETIVPHEFAVFQNDAGSVAQQEVSVPQDAGIKSDSHEDGGGKGSSDLSPVMNLNFMTEGETEGANNKDQILQLYRQGKSTVAIAKELGLGVGEVKLVIDLYKNL